MSTGLDPLDAADILLGPELSRSALLRAPKLQTSQELTLRVDRTMPFEFVARWLPAFCGLWGAKVTYDYSDYDAALNGIGGSSGYDGYIVWLDWRIYASSMSPREAAGWLAERLQQLRQSTDRTIWVNNWPEAPLADERLFSFRTRDSERSRQLNYWLGETIAEQTACECIDLNALARTSEAFWDPRNDAASHYPFSGEATLAIARHMGVHLLPAATRPRLKALALDLDDTLYRGVLGEDGIDGVTLTDGHADLQRLLARLKASGILLTICSRNEEQDVRELFEKRGDFPLRWLDFAAVAANWQSKPDNLIRLAAELNIDPSAMVFLDDNPVELLRMAAEQPSVHILRAEADAARTVEKVAHFPGLYQLRPDAEAGSRTRDVQANRQRERLRSEASDPLSYLASLQMVLRLHMNKADHVQRLHDMSHKTNQFNLALRRISLQEAQLMMDPEQYVTVTAALSDNLSDSGIIGAFVCRIEGTEARLIETLLSCRAFGRGIESLILVSLLELLTQRGVKWLRIDREEGTRNAPAREWAERLGPETGGRHSIRRLLGTLKKQLGNHPAKVEVL